MRAESSEMDGAIDFDHPQCSHDKAAMTIIHALKADYQFRNSFIRRHRFRSFHIDFLSIVHPNGIELLIGKRIPV
jgi:hypothetical protein